MAESLLFVGLLLMTLTAHTTLATDPDLTTDFNVTNPTVDDFTFTGFRNLQGQGLGMAKPNFAAFNMNFSGLNGLGLTAVLFEFGPQSQIDPHTHPRATEMFFVLSGEVNVGFVDTANELFETNLQTGDIFVFPKGMLHWQRNNGNGTASGFSALSSENPGTLLIAEALFTGGNTGLPDNVLSTAFGTNNWEVETLRTSVATKNNISITTPPAYGP